MGDLFGVLPVTYIEPVTSVLIRFRAETLYEFTVGVMKLLIRGVETT